MKIYLLITLFIVSFAFAQNDILQLKTGEEKKVVLVLDQMPDENSTLKYKELNSEEVIEISMSKVHKLTLSDGYVLYEDKEPLQIKTEPTVATTKSTTGTSDKIYLKSGEVKNVVLILDEIPTENSILYYKNIDSGKKQSISMSKVQKVELSDGYVLYETEIEVSIENTTATTESAITDSTSSNADTTITFVPAAPKIDCDGLTQELKKEFDYNSVMLYNEIKEEIATKQISFSQASYDMTESFKNDLYDFIEDEILLLKSTNSSVNALITVYVDTSGNVINKVDEVKNAKYLRNYTQLRESTIFPFFESHTFKPVDTVFNYSTTIKEFLLGYKEKFLKTECPDAFNDIYAIAKERLESIDKMIVPKNTVYQIPITYSFDSKFQTWIKYKDDVQIKNKGGNISITNSDVKEQFYSKIKKRKKKNGKYSVFTHYYKVLDNDLRMSVQSAKRKYIYYVYLGANIGTVFPLKNPNPQLKIGEIMPVEGFLIFHRIGFFGGYGLQVYDPYKNKTLDGNYYENVKYFHGGIYIGLAQYFYLKAGYAQLNYSNVEYNNDFEINRQDNLKRFGFLAGFSLIFPVIQLEGGYNYTLRAPYASVGINIPINR